MYERALCALTHSSRYTVACQGNKRDQVLMATNGNRPAVILFVVIAKKWRRLALPILLCSDAFNLWNTSPHTTCANLMTLTHMPSCPSTAPQCPLISDSMGRKICSAAPARSNCTTAGSFARVCGIGFVGVREFTCVLRDIDNAYWNETYSTCTGM